MRTIHPRLEEIRRRLMEPPAPPAPPAPLTPPRYNAPKRVGEAHAPAEAPSQELKDLGAAAAGTRAEPAAESSHPAAEGAERTVIDESPDENAHDQVAFKTPKALDGFAQAVADLFEPARQCQGRLVEINDAAESLIHLTRLALELCTPLESFHEHIRKLSSSFESMRTFRDELGVLAESFAPVRALHQQVIELAQTVRTHLAEVAIGLEPAKALRVEITNLSQALDSVNNLQLQFYELSKAFGDADEPK